jgi:phytanoyl-CoA hydroxylase
MPQLHPRNLGFEWRPSAGPRQILDRAQSRQYDEQGYFLLENAFSPTEMEAVVREIDPIEYRFEELLRTRYGGKISITKADAITFTINLVTKSKVLKAFSQHQIFRQLCHDTLGFPARLYWEQAVYKKPGNPEEFPWHQDNGYTFIEPQQYLTCWVALTDATLDNGCPWVVPGLHRLGTLAHRRTELGLECLTKPEGAVSVAARAGDIVVFSSLTPHRTGPNLTGSTRKAYILQYAHDGAVRWADDTEAPILQNDPERQYLLG